MINTPTFQITMSRRLLAIAVIIVSSSQSVFADGFEAQSWREMARFFGVGVGAGYHNQPCVPQRAHEYNRMLNGCANPGWRAWKQSQLANRVPHGAVVSNWPGEDGTPSCSHCGHNAYGGAMATQVPMTNNLGLDTTVMEPDEKEPNEAKKSDGNALFGPDTRSDIGDTSKQPGVKRDSGFEQLPSKTRDEINSRTAAFNRGIAGRR